jgi:hypothetical protein
MEQHFGYCQRIRRKMRNIFEEEATANENAKARRLATSIP